MTDDEKIKLVATMAATIYSTELHSGPYSVTVAVSILDLTIEQLKEKGMIKND